MEISAEIREILRDSLSISIETSREIEGETEYIRTDVSLLLDGKEIASESSTC